MSISFIIGLIILSIFFTVAFGFRNSHQFHEMVNRLTGDFSKVTYHSRTWHKYQALVQGVFFVTLGIASHNVWIPLICAALFWLIFDIIVNTQGLNQKWNYVGKTAWIDRMYQKLPWPGMAMIISKIVVLAGFIYLYIKY